jgi:DNA-binding NarL/FixJ family response regulator
MAGLLWNEDNPVDQIRTAMVTITPIISDIIETMLSARASLNVLAHFNDREEIAERLVAVSPDLVLIGLQHEETDDIARALLMLIPVAKVVAISSDGRNAYVHEMRAHRRALADVSPRTLINAILGT